MKKNLSFLIVAVFTLFLFSNNVKADTNKAYWNVGQGMKYHTLRDAIRETLRERLKDKFSQEWMEEACIHVRENGESIEHCVNRLYDEEADRRLFINKIKFINNPDNYTELPGTFYGGGFLSEDDDNQVRIYLKKYSCDSIENVEIIFNGKLVLNSDSSDLFANLDAESIEGLEYLDTSNVTNMSGMFRRNSLATLDVSSFDTSKVTDMSNMFSYNVFENLALSNFNTSKVTNMSGMFSYSGSDFEFKELNLSNFDTSKVTNMSNMFEGSRLTSVNLSSFDTSKVTNMDSMFAHNKLLTSLDLSNFNTSKVTNMSFMFYDNSLTTINVSNFNTENVEYMNDMFAHNELTSLDLSNFNTSKVINMSGMFYDNNLSTLNVSSFDTSKVTNMSFMFADNKLTTLDVSSFDTSKVTDMSNMFSWTGLNVINVSNFDTSKVTNMSEMFNSNNLTTIDLSNFNTENVENMCSMFANNKFTILDISNFNTSKVTDMSGMFERIPELTTIYTGDGFTTKNIENKDGHGMFYGSISLVGENGTKYSFDENEFYKEDPDLTTISAVYARIDESGKPGYFSIKPENKLSNYNISSIENQTYNGKTITPNVTVKNNSKTLVKDKDYTVSYSNNINVGTATVTVVGKGKYIGTKTATFKITPMNIGGASLSKVATQKYAGKALTPNVTVTLNGKILVKNQDYTISYSNNVNTGKAYVKVVGKGNYIGTRQTYFVIAPTSASNIHVTSETQGSIYFAWNKAPGNVSGYSVYKYTGNKKILMGNTTSTSYGVKSLSAATTYQYRVVPYTIVEGQKYYGNEVILTATTKTLKPSIKLSSKVRKVTIKWNKVKGANGYEVYMSTKKNSGYKKIKTTTGKSFTKTKLTRKKRYYFKVRTYRKVNGKTVYSYYSPIKSIKVK